MCVLRGVKRQDFVVFQTAQRGVDRCAVLRVVGFDQPRLNRAGIDGAELGRDRIDRPRQWVIGMLKRDVITIRKSFEMANCGVAI